MSLLKEFKEFAVKGNVIDMAVGIIIGAAFGKIVTSLVNDIIMPPIGKLIGGVTFTDLKYVLEEAVIQNGETIKPEVAINYGNFIQTLIDFIILAFIIFMMVKGINSLKRKEVEQPAAPAAPSEEVVLLTQIRDLLNKK